MTLDAKTLALYWECPVSVTNLEGRYETIVDQDFFNDFFDADEGEFLNNPMLILRLLSSMTEEEMKELDKTKAFQRASPVHKIGVMVWTTESFRWALSKHFDLFGLIESKQAIDQTTIK